MIADWLFSFPLYYITLFMVICFHDTISKIPTFFGSILHISISEKGLRLHAAHIPNAISSISSLFDISRHKSPSPHFRIAFSPHFHFIDTINPRSTPIIIENAQDRVCILSTPRVFKSVSNQFQVIRTPKLRQYTRRSIKIEICNTANVIL